jgi:Sulfotransferase family
MFFLRRSRFRSPGLPRPIEPPTPAEIAGNQVHEDKMLFFLHIPKTGGQTVASRLASAFLPNRVRILQDDLRFPEGVELLRGFCQTRDFVESHVAGPLLAEICDLQLLTVIRNPIDRLISMYRHILREPRNQLHRAACKMRPLAFFRNYGDLFRNAQTRYIVNALFSCPDSVLVEEDYQRWLFRQFHAALDRITFLVPLERIDEFITLWSAETGRLVPQADRYLNGAPPDEVNLDEIRHVIQRLPELYSLDTELWQAARLWFSSYRAKVLARFMRTTEPLNSSLAFFVEAEGDGIWLTRGWYPPFLNARGSKEWWAGPRRTAEIDLRRNYHASQLIFEITVVVGIEPSEIMFFAKSSGERLAADMWDADEGTTFVRIDISGLEQLDTIVTLVPEVYSPIQVDDRDDDTMRRSFATTGWYIGEVVYPEGIPSITGDSGTSRLTAHNPVEIASRRLSSGRPSAGPVGSR